MNSLRMAVLCTGKYLTSPRMDPPVVLFISKEVSPESVMFARQHNKAFLQILPIFFPNLRKLSLASCRCWHQPCPSDYFTVQCIWVWHSVSSWCLLWNLSSTEPMLLVDELGKSLFGAEGPPPVTPVPCRLISSADKDDWDMALCFITASTSPP